MTVSGMTVATGDQLEPGRPQLTAVFADPGPRIVPFALPGQVTFSNGR
jgi:hypothetical protein